MTQFDIHWLLNRYMLKLHVILTHFLFPSCFIIAFDSTTWCFFSQMFFCYSWLWTTGHFGPELSFAWFMGSLLFCFSHIWLLYLTVFFLSLPSLNIVLLFYKLWWKVNCKFDSLLDSGLIFSTVTSLLIHHWQWRWFKQLTEYFCFTHGYLKWVSGFESLHFFVHWFCLLNIPAFENWIDRYVVFFSSGSKPHLIFNMGSMKVLIL